MMGRLQMLASGELDERADRLLAMLGRCELCPRACGVNRLSGEIGVCGSASAVVSAATAHFGEEPGISGPGGSGTVFFRGCNLRCHYCQNFEISQGEVQSGPVDHHADIELIASAMLGLQSRGCCNINLVTPSHTAAHAVGAIGRATRAGLNLPIVWNTSSYESVATLELLEGIVDVWLADLRYSDSAAADECSSAPDYVKVARAAIVEMARQTGTVCVRRDDGVITRGMIIRLLVLPNDMAGVRESLDFIAKNLGTDVQIAIMSQYFPTSRAMLNPLLSRRVSASEYERVVAHAVRLGFDNALVQDLSAQDYYRPDFGRGSEPFADAPNLDPTGGDAADHNG